MQLRSPRDAGNGNRNGGNGNRADSVNIIIQATNKASQILTGVGVELSKVGDAATFAQERVAMLATAIGSGFSTSVAQVQHLVGAVELVRQGISSPVGQSIISEIQSAAEAAVTEVQSLSSVLEAAGKVATTAFSGVALDLSSDLYSKALLGSVAELPDKIRQLDAALEEARSTGASESRIQALQDRRNASYDKLIKLDPSQRYEMASQSAASKLTNRLVEGFVDLPEKIPFLEKLISPDRLARAVGPLDKLLSDVVLNKFLQNKVPPAIKTVLGKVFQEDVGELLNKQVKSSDLLANAILDPTEQALKQGSALRALETKIAGVLSKGFKLGMMELEKVVDYGTEYLGKSAAQSLTRNIDGALTGANFEDERMNRFEQLDELFAGRLTKWMTPAADKFGSTLAKLIPLGADFRNDTGGEIHWQTVGKAGGYVNEQTKGAIAGATGNQDLNFWKIQDAINMATGRSLVSDVIDQGTGGATFKLGKQLADLIQLSERADAGLDKLFKNISRVGGKRAIGELANKGIEEVNKRIPSMVKSAFELVQTLFPQETARVKANLLRQVSKLAEQGFDALDSMIERLTSSPAQRLQKEVDQLQPLANQVDPLSEKLAGLREQAMWIASSPASSGQKQTVLWALMQQIDQLAPQLDNAQKAADRITEIQGVVQQKNQAVDPTAYLQEGLQAVQNTGTTAVTEAANQTQQALSTLADQAQQVGTQLTDAASGPAEQLKQGLQAVQEVGSQALTDLGGKAQQVGTQLTDAASGPAEQLKQGLQAVQEVGSQAFSVISDQAQQVGSQVAEVASGPTEQLKQGLQTVQETGGQALSSLGNQAKKIVQQSLSQFGGIQQSVQQQASVIAQTQQKVQEAMASGEAGAEALVESYQQQVQTLEDSFNKSPLERITGKLQSFAERLGTSLQLDDILGTFAAGFNQIDEELDGALSFGLGQLGKRAGGSFIAGFRDELFAQMAPVINQVDDFVVKSYQQLEALPDRFGNPLGMGADAFGYLAGGSEPVELFDTLKQGAIGFSETINNVSQQIFFFQAGMQALQQLVLGGPFELLIGQTVTLREQLLATQSSLVATNKVIQNGTKITDPTAAIRALEQPINSAIDRIREGSLELVGVTSNDLIDSFRIISGLSSQVEMNLDESADLTLSMAAAMGTLQIPIAAARQEITSIMQGAISTDSVLAKSLGITNDQVAVWKQQGRVFEELTRRLEAFRAGNKLAAGELSGLTSNIKDIFEQVMQKAGEPLLDKILPQVEEFYNYLSSNREELTKNIAQLADGVFTALQKIVDAAKAVYSSVSKVLGQVPQKLVDALVKAATSVADAVQKALVLFQPMIDVLAEVMKNASFLAGPFFSIAAQLKVLQLGVKGVTGSFGFLGNVLPGVGEVLFLIRQRMLPMVNMFPALSKEIGMGGAGFLMLGKHMNEIPGAAGVVLKALDKFGPFGKLIAGFIPQISGLGIQMVGLAKNFEPLKGMLQNVMQLSPQVVSGLAKIADESSVTKDTGLGAQLKKVAGDLKVFAKNGDISTVVTEKFNGVLQEAGVELKNFSIRSVILGGSLTAAFIAFNELILKNETVKAGLKKVGEEIGKLIDFFKSVGSVLGNEVFMAVGGVVGLFTLGLNPALKALKEAMTIGAIEAFAEQFQVFAGALKKVDATVQNAGNNIRKTFDRMWSGGAGEAKRFIQRLQADGATIEKEIASRQARLEQLNQAIDTAAPDQDVEGLKADRMDISGEVEALEKSRERINQTIGQIEEDIAQMPPSVAQKVQAGVGKVKAGIADLPNVMQSASQNVKKVMTTNVSEIVPAMSNAVKGGVAQVRKSVTGMKNVVTSSFVSMKVRAQSLAAGLNAELATMAIQMALIGGAVLAVTTAIGTYTTLMDARNKASKDFAESIADATNKMELLAKAEAEASNASEEGMDRRSQRLKEIQESQSILEKVFEFLRSAINGAIAAVQAVFFKLPGLIAQKISEAANSVGNFFKKIPVLGTVIEGLASVFGKVGSAINTAFSPVARLLKPVTDLFAMILSGGKQIISFLSKFRLTSGAESQLQNETVGFDKALTEAKDKLDKLRSSKEQYAKWQQELAELQAQQAQARGQGDDEEVKRLQQEIDLTQEKIKAKGDEIGATISGLEALDAPTDAQQLRQAELVEDAKKLRTEFEGLGDATILPPDLLRIGTLTEQVSNNLRNAVADTKRFMAEGAPNSEAFGQKAKELLDYTKQALEMGLITEEQARENYQLVLNSAAATPDVLQQAQQAITETYKTEGDRRVSEVQRQQQQIEALVANQNLSEAEGERRLTKLKADELQTRLDDRAKAYQDQMAQDQKELESEVGTIDEKILLQKKMLANPDATKEDKEAAQKEIDALTQKRQQAIETFNQKRIAADRIYANEKQQLDTELAQTNSQVREQEQQAKIQDYEEAQALLESQQAQGLIDAEKFAKKSLENTRARLSQEATMLTEQRSKLLQPLEATSPELFKTVSAEKDIMAQRQLLREALGKATTQAEKDAINSAIQGLEELAVKEANINKERAEARNQYYDSLRADAQEDAQEQQSILEGKKAQGLVTEQEYADQSLANTNDQLDRELELIEQQRKELNANDTEGMEALAAKEGEINKRRVDAQQQYYDTILAIAERARKKLLDEAQSAELDAQIATQELINNGDIQQSQADLQRLDAAQERANREIEIEEQKLADLMAMPAFSDPQKEAERQQQIRDSRMRTQQLTLQIAEGEYRRQELIRAELQKQMDRQVQQAENLGQVKVMGLEAEQRRIDAINKTLDTQQKILEARQEYLNASSALLNAQLDVLGKTTRSQRDQREIAELRARVELRMLDQKQEMERQALQLQQEQLRLSLQREQAENRIAQIKNQAETAKAVAEYAKVQADPEATPEQIEAARLGVVSSMMTGRALQEEGIMLGRQGEIQESLFAQEEAAMGRRQQGERFTARGNYLDTLRGSERREYAADLQEDILNNLGMDSLSSLRSNRNQARLANRFTRNALPPASLTPDALPPIPNLSQYNPVMPGLMGQLNNPELVQALNDATAAFQGLQGLQVQQENQIINQFTGQDVNNGNFQRRVQQQTLNTLYGVADKLQQRRRLAPT